MGVLSEMIRYVKISKFAEKQLRSMPLFIVKKLRAWIDDVQERGLEEVRKTPAFHDEPLKGIRKGQRSIRLSRAYRAIYEIYRDDSVEFALIEEVNKHDY